MNLNLIIPEGFATDGLKKKESPEPVPLVKAGGIANNSQLAPTEGDTPDILKKKAEDRAKLWDTSNIDDINQRVKINENRIKFGVNDKEKYNWDKQELYQSLNTPLPIDNKTVTELSGQAAKKIGISPELLSMNMLQEGVRGIVKQGLAKSQAYDEANIDKEKYKIDGGALNYGLDNFGDMADMFKKKGYLPKDFDFAKVPGTNNRGVVANGPAFKNNEDAMVAVAAYLKYNQDQVSDYAKEKGVKLTEEAKDYLTSKAYNSGPKRANEIIDGIKSGKVKMEDFEGNADKMQGKTNAHFNIGARMWIRNQLKNPDALKGEGSNVKQEQPAPKKQQSDPKWNSVNIVPNMESGTMIMKNSSGDAIDLGVDVSEWKKLSPQEKANITSKARPINHP